MATWKKTQFKGVYYRTHQTRKHGVKFDQYFAITYRYDGKQKWEGVGWASDGNTSAEAKDLLDELTKNQNKGEGAYSLKEKREIKKFDDARKAALAEEEQRKTVTFSSFWESQYWPMQSHKAKGSKEAETALYKHWIKPVMGDKRFNEIGDLDLQRIKAAMQKADKAPASIKYAFAVVSQVWTLASGCGYATTTCPTRSKNVRPPKFDNKRTRHLSPEEARRLLASLKLRSEQAHGMTVLALYAGLRFSEIASMTWNDVDLVHGIITIRNPKNKKNRVAFINSHIREVLEAKKLQGNEGLVFKDQKGAKVASITNVYRHVANELFNQGVTDHLQRVGFHTLRHTFASWLVGDGQNLYAVKELLGHSDFKMTQRYSHLAPDGLREVAKSLENKLDQNIPAGIDAFIAN